MTAPIGARVIDPEILKLDQPIRFPVGTRLRLVVEPEVDDGEAAPWLNRAANGLELAYSTEEPDYPLHLIKGPDTRL